MSTSLAFVSEEITIYLGITILIAGIIGGVLNLTVFLSLRTFRQSSCAFFLTVMSVVCTGYLITGFLPSILNNGFGYDLTQGSKVYCKFRWYLLQLCILTTFTCISLATIDQFFATCPRPRWQQWCNIKFSRRILSVFIFLWCLHGIPFVIFYDINGTSCSQKNSIFSGYLTYFYLPILIGAIPISITVLFGILAYYNTQQLAHRTVPLVRRELDKQLTTMVLIQVIFNFFAVTPYTILTVVTLIIGPIQDPFISAQVALTKTSFNILYYFFFASPFYIYICTSERFRLQLFHVLFKMHLNRCRPRQTNINQIEPQN